MKEVFSFGCLDCAPGVFLGYEIHDSNLIYTPEIQHRYQEWPYSESRRTCLFQSIILGYQFSSTSSDGSLGSRFPRPVCWHSAAQQHGHGHCTWRTNFSVVPWRYPNNKNEKPWSWTWAVIISPQLLGLFLGYDILSSYMGRLPSYYKDPY